MKSNVIKYSLAGIVISLAMLVGSGNALATSGMGGTTDASGAVGERAGSSLPTGCHDADADGYSPDGGVCGPVDCNDNDPAINPGAREVCGDGIDNDCDGKVDSADSECNGRDCIPGLIKPPAPVVITRSKWYPDAGKLEVYGKQAPIGTAVNLLNATTGALIDSGITRGDGWWKFNLYELAVVPCRIRIEIAGQAAEHHVNSAPASCDNANPPANKAPESTIVAPADGTSVRRGETVSFLGAGFDPDGNTPVTYEWDFGGAATSHQQNPQVVFNSVGTVTVRLTVKDAKGLADPSPASIAIKVVAPVADVTIDKAVWAYGHLLIAGKGAPAGSVVQLFDAYTRGHLGATRSSRSGAWKLEVRGPRPVPCAVLVKAGGKSAIKAVGDAPRHCPRQGDSDRGRWHNRERGDD